jgi:flavin reductase (DIM6/NTAB) family NADH-FMN oxidoreductase RutF
MNNYFLDMIKIDPVQIPVPKLHQILLGTVAPRPIALASTIDSMGRPNLSPFSFFNVFGVNPTTLIFSPSRRSRDNTVKHTYENLKEVPEVVINMVNFAMVEQISLASSEYPKGVNEFVKAGLSPVPSERVKPFRVKESPVQFECKVRQIIETGDRGGAGNLVICEILLIHLQDSLFNEAGIIDPDKIDLVARMGGDYYCRASGDAVFMVRKPLKKLGIGIDNLPGNIRNSVYLSGNDLGKLGNIEALPAAHEIEEFMNEEQKQNFYFPSPNEIDDEKVIACAKNLLEGNQPLLALKILMGYLTR